MHPAEGSHAARWPLPPRRPRLLQVHLADFGHTTSQPHLRRRPRLLGLQCAHGSHAARRGRPPRRERIPQMHLAGECHGRGSSRGGCSARSREWSTDWQEAEAAAPVTTSGGGESTPEPCTWQLLNPLAAPCSARLRSSRRQSARGSGQKAERNGLKSGGRPGRQRLGSGTSQVSAHHSRAFRDVRAGQLQVCG
jgi:hypothetical protein